MILATNDDGIFAPGLWALVRELKLLDSVTAAAPDREQSATGTGITLRQPLRVRTATALEPDVNTYGVEGTPGDSVIMALERLATDARAVISGINNGHNMGDDILISGTVGAALQGYLRGLPAIAMSIEEPSPDNFATAARLGRILLKRIFDGVLPADIFLNVNVPDVPLDKIKGVMVAQPAHKTHIDSVKEGSDGRREYFWLVRRKLDRQPSDSSDIWAIEHDYIAITPLHTALFRRPSPEMGPDVCAGIFEELCQ
ncbi:MAG: 5'/3'-nucleotidase SurE [Dehalococcoidia bacterium]|nr:5'/3'-nucleotidase SurE [Dehalococcoidia bacterium]